MPKTIDVLAQPFDWVDIPAGTVTLINDWDDHTTGYLPRNQPQAFTVDAFTIAKYPVTEAQFNQFVDAKGYQQKKWWTEEGWDVLQTIGWDKPSPPHDRIWDMPNNPVTGISWYEAAAFCLWLKDVTDEDIRLPTEQHWQRAAQGDDQRIYPWGDLWDASRCHNNTGDKSDVSWSITGYEDRGASPFGVVDMSGNVWEWCLTDYYRGKNDLNERNIRVRVIRGGSWNDENPNFFRVIHRHRLGPSNRNDNIGFRIVCV